MQHRIAVLDDYGNLARHYGDWDRFGDAVTIYNDHLADPDAVVERLEPYDVVALMRERTPFSRGLIARLPNLRLIVTSGMWNRAIDLEACAGRGIVVSGTDTGASAVIEITWALMLALAHRITIVDRDLHEGRWQNGLGDSLRGKTLGIVGLGRIGARIATIASAFGMPVIAWSQNLTAPRAEECGAALVARDELFRRADVVSVHVVSSERTRGLVGAHELGLMKPSAFLINTARGPIVDERALLDALGSGRIAGAGLDVYDVEPLPPDHPLRRAPNTVLTPHIGYATDGSFRIYYPQMIEDIEAWVRGTPIRVLGATGVKEGQGTAR